MNRTVAIIAAAVVIGAGLWVRMRSASADIPMALAMDAAQTAVATCKANGYNVTVTVMEPDMITRIVLRGDGAPGPTVEIGRRKAYTVIKTGMSSGEFGKTVPAPPAAATPAPAGPPPGPPKMPGPVNGDPSLITWPGGLPIKVGDKLVGAMSASGAPGGDKDEACVSAGLAKIAGQLR